MNPASERKSQRKSHEKGAGNVQSVGAVVWPVQVASVHDELEHLLVGQALVRLLGQRADLPQNHPKRPGRQEENEGSRVAMPGDVFRPKNSRGVY